MSGLTKRYAGRVALADVAFNANCGELVGLIGPNGAGKTTLLEAVAGLLPVEAGELTWNGIAMPPARRREFMFYLPDGIKPYQDQPVVRVLRFFAGIYRRPDTAVADTVASLGLAPVLRERVRALSKGFNRRLLLAVALLAPHPLLLMDEPFDGFDLRQVQGIAGVLRREATRGRTLVLAMHQLMDAEKVCDRFILLCDGRVRGAGTRRTRPRCRYARPITCAHATSRCDPRGGFSCAHLTRPRWRRAHRCRRYSPRSSGKS